MRLYHSQTSPFVRKVMVQILESGLADAVTIVPVSGTPIEPGTMPVDQNPLGKIPALVTDDGRALYDSRVISRYLDDLSGAGLYPNGAALWDVLTLEATADGIMDAAVLMILESRVRPEEKRFADWTDAQWGKVTRALDAVEDRWIPALSEPVNMAQIGLGCALSYIDFRFGDRPWRAERPRLAAWHAAFSDRPTMQATRPPG